MNYIGRPLEIKDGKCETDEDVTCALGKWELLNIKRSRDAMAPVYLTRDADLMLSPFEPFWPVIHG